MENKLLDDRVKEREDSDISFWFIVTSLMVSPMAFVIGLIFYVLLKIKLDKLIAGIVVFLFSVLSFGLFYLLNRPHEIFLVEIQKVVAFETILKILKSFRGGHGLFDIEILKFWGLGFNLISYSVSSFILSMGLILSPDTYEKQVEDIQEKMEHKHLESRPGKKILDFNSTSHLLAIGTTGSGKSANILNYLEDNIKKNGFSIVIDGKGGLREYDLATVTRKMASKYNRKVYMVNLSNTHDTSPYNPFLGLSATQAKDMLVSMSEWTEEHYKQLSARYWQVMAEVLNVVGIPLAFESIIKFSNPDIFLKLLNDVKDSRKISDNLYKIAEELANGESGKQAKIAIGRTAVVYEGDGKRLFGVEDSFNLRTAYEENAIVIVLLNEFLYPDFAKSLGHLVLDDMKSLIGELLSKDDKRKVLFVLEELGVYATQDIDGLLNRSRSAGAKVICSMQTFADTDKVSPELTRVILGNCNDYLIMRTNDPDTAERLASMIGTKKALEKTVRTELGYGTGQSSNKMVNEFIISPNEIKNFPNNYGIYYTKTNEKNRYSFKRFKTTFVKI